MSRFGDDHASLIGILFATEGLHVLGTQPSWVTIKLMLAQGVPGDEMGAGPLTGESERDLSGCNPSADDGDGFL